jgi:chaperonin GroES
LKPKLIKSNQAEYEIADWNGKNETGYEPLGDRVLVLPDQAKSQTSGGIYIADDLLERLNLSGTSGTVIAVGEDAFRWSADRQRPWGNSYRPKPGDHVFFEKFAGLVVPGDDGKSYRAMDDKTIGLVRTAT